MKRRFQFRLGRLLRIREIEERQARTAWATAEQAAGQAEREVQRAQAALAEARGSLLEARTASSLGGALLLERLVDARTSELSSAVEESRTRRLQADRLAEAWRTAEAARKALVELETRGRKEHRLAVEAVDQREQDERASSRWTRADSEEGSSPRGAAADS